MKAATAIFVGGIAAAVVGTGWLAYVLSGTGLDVPKLPDIGVKEPDCKKTAPLTAPTLVTFYDFARGLAVAWKPDVIVTRLDHLAMSSPLQMNGSSRLWTAGFFSPSANRTMLIHTGDAKLYCSTVAGDVSGRIPKFKGEPMLEGGALYKIAEKHGKAEMKKGLGVGVYLWADPGDNHAAWHIAFYDKQGYSSGPVVVVNASSGAVEKIEKSK
jgi:hypothetical protein